MSLHRWFSWVPWLAVMHLAACARDSEPTNDVGDPTSGTATMTVDVGTASSTGGSGAGSGGSSEASSVASVTMSSATTGSSSGGADTTGGETSAGGVDASSTLGGSSGTQAAGGTLGAGAGGSGGRSTVDLSVPHACWRFGDDGPYLHVYQYDEATGTCVMVMLLKGGSGCQLQLEGDDWCVVAAGSSESTTPCEILEPSLVGPPSSAIEGTYMVTEPEEVRQEATVELDLTVHFERDDEVVGIPIEVPACRATYDCAACLGN